MSLDALRVRQADATNNAASRVTARGASEIVLPKVIALQGEQAEVRDPNEAAERARNRLWRQRHLRQNQHQEESSL